MDQTKYFNAYLNATSATLHEYVTATLQLRAQNTVLEESIAAHIHVVDNLKAQLDAANGIISELQQQKSQIAQAATDANNWKTLYEESANKLSHYDTFVNQIKEMKQKLQEKDVKINELTSIVEYRDGEIEGLKGQVSDVVTLKWELDKIKEVKKESKKRAKKPVAIVEAPSLQDNNDF